MILINSNFDPNVQIVQLDTQGRWIILNMVLDHKQIWLINLYGPNNDDPQFFDKMLAIKIRSNNNIRGLEIQGLKTKVSLYADDSCFLLDPQLESLHSLIEDLDTCSNLSGLKPNYDKCTILRIGSLK